MCSPPRFLPISPCSVQEWDDQKWCWFREGETAWEIGQFYGPLIFANCISVVTFTWAYYVISSVMHADGNLLEIEEGEVGVFLGGVGCCFFGFKVCGLWMFSLGFVFSLFHRSRRYCFFLVSLIASLPPCLD